MLEARQNVTFGKDRSPLPVSLMARKRGVPVVPHVGDMGGLHQHLVLFNRVAPGHEPPLLEARKYLAPAFRLGTCVFDFQRIRSSRRLSYHGHDVRSVSRSNSFWVPG